MRNALTTRVVLGTSIGALGLLFLGVGCSAEPALDNGEYPTTYKDGSPGLADTADAETNTAEPGDPEPVFWSLDGELVLTDKGPDLDASSLSVSFWTEDGVKTCKEPVQLDVLTIAADDAPESKDASLLAAWFEVELDTSPGADLGCPSWPMGRLGIGLGPYDGSLNPALETRGYNETDLLGLYVQNPAIDTTVYLLGVGGTEAMFEGTVVTEPAAALEPGTYRLRSLTVLDL